MLEVHKQRTNMRNLLTQVVINTRKKGTLEQAQIILVARNPRFWSGAGISVRIMSELKFIFETSLILYSISYTFQCICNTTLNKY